MFRFVVLGICASVLANCSGVQGAFENSYAGGYAMETRLGGYFNTAWPSVPTSGSAKFDGYALAKLFDAGNVYQITGSSTVDIDFGTKFASGSLSDFFGTDFDGNIDVYTGTIDMPFGSIAVFDPNDIYISYAGTLEGNGDTIDLNGTLAGRFKGTPIVGIWLDDLVSTTSLNGSAIAGSLFVIGEN